ncbi:MAG: DUF2293 domain-containing protein [Sandaracinaceae bacterium]|nr:MAG: DUF2293 domain-containing protein [Sandaracinaceae bacterium]
MPEKSPEKLVVAPDPDPRVVRLPSGERRAVPDTWALLPPGDAGLTRRVKAAGPSWTVQEMKGRKKFSRGVWAPAANIEAAQAAIEAERATPAYQKRLAADRRRRAEAHEQYVEDFEAAVLAFLAFHPAHRALAREMAARITAHATPVGSGTVARTQRIPIERRAEAAVIAWMRHQTTAYDDMAIPRVKGARREVRRMLAQRSKQLLARYRRGESASPECPLQRALRDCR